MDLISFYTNGKIENISLLKLENHLKYTPIRNGLKNGFVYKDNNKYVPIKCIRNYYKDPLTGKLIPNIKLTNPCMTIRSKFGLNHSCHNCIDCHLDMINEYWNGNAELYVKNAKKNS